MIEGADGGDPEQYVRDLLDRGERIMGFGHRSIGPIDPRATVLKRTAFELGVPKAEVAAALEEAALKVLRESATGSSSERGVLGCRRPRLRGHPRRADAGDVRLRRTAGWSAHILEQKRTGRLIRPGARYIGPPPRPVSELSR